MKKMKKFLCAALASTMVFAMAAPSLAAEITMTPAGVTQGSTENPLKQTYHAYKIFDLASHDGSNYSYYLANYNNSELPNPWKEFITNYEIGGQPAFTLNNDGYVISTLIAKDSEDAAAFAKAAVEHAENYNKTVSEENRIGEEKISTNGETVTWTGLSEGYYVIDSTVGSLCLLGTNDAIVNLTDKNVAPGLKKYVDGEDVNVQIGQTASYRVVVSAGKGAIDYKLTDTMSEALDFVENTEKVYKVSIKEVKEGLGENPTEEDINNAIKEITFTDNDSRKITSGYTVTPNENKHGFVITFDNKTTATWTNDDMIVVIYDATVNANAANGVAITNNAKLNYGENEETPDIPDVPSYTYQFDLQKVNMLANGDAGDEELTGAKFKLYASNDNNAVALNLVAMDDITDTAGKTIKVYRMATADDVENTIVTEIEVGYAIIRGLDNDTTYYLEETAAPKGYNLLTGKVEVQKEFIKQITDTNTADKGENAKKIANSTGLLLPSTGGIGTTIFYAAGIILMAGAVFFVVRRKKA